MNKSGKAPLRIALYGMDSRTCKAMEMYFKGPCCGSAVVVAEPEADIDMIDADSGNAKEILETRKACTPNRPVILLSLENLRIDNTFFIKKPITVAQLDDVFAKIKTQNKLSRKIDVDALVVPEVAPEPDHEVVIRTESNSKPDIEVYLKKSASERQFHKDELLKDKKYQSVMQQNEGGFTSFLGTLNDIDFNDREQLLTACFDPRLYFLAYVQSAYKTAKFQTKPLLLKSIWKPLFIFPEQDTVWLDADDKQLRAFASISINRTTSKIALTEADPALITNLAVDKFQDIHAFIWKLAIWTSKGRFPIGLDMLHPVFMERWPNFTRLVITPEALRISALLIQNPRTPVDVAAMLDIKPQYVYVFISACHATGLLRQSERLADSVFVPEEPKKPKSQGVLAKIINKLRGI